ncbi:hypothetical protein [Paenibacillus sp. MMS18-CY102]|uniref:hypothetical protein n=1 Tax=Paenibacillus sp. MMS18-CY102 TaxID=2682849 RepID=UPI0013654A30|nr:hypothetical protein [Paenibacillus sp. MMS18-CY102]MWC27344.1 hypothetical protein [Paenibacillus sp. MMS18-CY102]
MGLDVLLYDQNDTLLDKFVIEEDLHSAIFYKTNNWGSFQWLRKIKDYYSPNLHLSATEVELFKDDLRLYQNFINKHDAVMISDMVGKRSIQKLYRVHIVGD